MHFDRRNEVRRTKRVLLAQEDLPLRRLLSLTLRLDGFEVVEAVGAGEILDFVFRRREDVDLIVAEGRGPLASGFEVIVALRHTRREIPVILVGDDLAEDAEMAAHRFRVRLLRKPLDLEELRLAAARLLDAR